VGEKEAGPKATVQEKGEKKSEKHRPAKRGPVLCDHEKERKVDCLQPKKRKKGYAREIRGSSAEETEALGKRSPAEGPK